MCNTLQCTLKLKIAKSYEHKLISPNLLSDIRDYT